MTIQDEDKIDQRREGINQRREIDIRRRKIEKLENIIGNIIFIGVMFMSISVIFNLEVGSKSLFIFIVILLGIARFNLNENQSNIEICDMLENINLMAAHLIALDKTISKIQKLCTDEDILGNTRDEILREIDSIREKYER